MSAAISVVEHKIAASSNCWRGIDVPIHVQADEVEWVTKRTGVGEDSLVAHGAGDVVAVGDFEVSLIHTPDTRRVVSACW